MSIEELEAEALKLKPAAHARLAERLLDSLENLSDEENARVGRGSPASFGRLGRGPDLGPTR